MRYHPHALVESDSVGEGTRVWAFAHILAGAEVGCNVNVGDHSFIEGGAVVGDNVTIKNQVCIWEGVTIEDDVFIGPRVTFTNDRYPRSPRMPAVQARYEQKETWLSRTRVGRGASIGAGAIVCPGIELGAYCMIAAGAVVTKDVPPFSLIMGTPGKHCGDVCSCGLRLNGPFARTPCASCGQTGEDRELLIAAHLAQPEQAT